MGSFAKQCDLVGKPGPQRFESRTQSRELLDMCSRKRFQLFLPELSQPKPYDTVISRVIVPVHQAGGDRSVDELDNGVVPEQQVRGYVGDGGG